MDRKLRAITSLIAVLITMGVLWYANRPVVVKKATWQDVVVDAQAGGYRLIEVEDLLKRYQHSSQALLLVDTRQTWEHRTGHIKGSVNFPIEPTWWSRWTKKSELKEFLGPSKSKFIVFY